MLGMAPLGSVPLGAGPAFAIGERIATFDVAAPSEALGPSLIEVVSFVDRALIERMYRNPSDLRTIDRRHFEEVVAEIWSGFGYEVELTKRTRDGGKDVVAVRRREVNTRFLIECKRPDPGNKIAVSTVRELYGVKGDFGANKAILATTSYLTGPAQEFVDRHPWELEARDFEGLMEWIRAYLSRKS